MELSSRACISDPGAAGQGRTAGLRDGRSIRAVLSTVKEKGAV